MQTVTTLYSSAINAKKRSIQAILDLYTGDALTDSFQSDRIVNIEIQRAGEQSKFFGFGVSHKATIKLLDKNRELNITKENSFKLQLGVEVLGETEYKSFPKFYVSEVTRDEKTNELTIVAYDILENANKHTVSELGITAPYTVKEYVETAATFLDGVERGDTKMPFPLKESPNAYASAKAYCSFDEETQVITVNGSTNLATNHVVKYDLLAVTDNASGRHVFHPGVYTLRVEVVGGSSLNNNWYIMLSTGSNQYKTEPIDVKVEDYGEGWNTWELSGMSLYLTGVDTYDNFQIRMIITKKTDEQVFNDTTIPGLSLSYPEGANFEGSETLREALTAAAEATQTIFYVGADDAIHFRRLGTTLDKTITKDIYIDLTSGANRTLQTICSATELGDNLSASKETPGETQYVRNNPFWELREDIAAVVDAALDEVGDMAINEFSCEWRGDPALEPGDRLAYATKDDKIGYTYLINDTLTYNGGLRQKTDWSFKESEETASNPTSLGEVIKQTYAKVDKQNKQIEIVASEASENKQELAALKINTESISASVSKIEEANTEAIASLNGELVTLNKKVEASITAEDVQLQIKSEISNGVDKVTTATGFTFNEDGLTIAKTGSEMKTNIDEDGMSVYRDNQEVLTADNQGVIAYNLKAKTYLIVGENSRFEDFTSTTGEQRTGCFWIGG